MGEPRSEFAIQFLYKQGHFYSCHLSMCHDGDSVTCKSEKPRCAPSHGHISKFPKGHLSECFSYLFLGFLMLKIQLKELKISLKHK